MSRPKTYSDNYLEENKILHNRPNGFGGGGHKHTDTVLALAAKYDCKSMLDYGAGQATLTNKIIQKTNHQFTMGIQAYDPAVARISQAPRKADLVVCTDVLEHIEPEYLESVLQELYELSQKVTYLYIATITTEKRLTDGRSAHLIVKSPDWWIKQLKSVGFKIQEVTENIATSKKPELRGIFVIATPQTED